MSVRLRRGRFGVSCVCIVADRGMIIAALESRKLEYILGVRQRNSPEVYDRVIADPAPFVPIAVPPLRQAQERRRAHRTGGQRGQAR